MYRHKAATKISSGASKEKLPRRFEENEEKEEMVILEINPKAPKRTIRGKFAGRQICHPYWSGTWAHNFP